VDGFRNRDRFGGVVVAARVLAPKCFGLYGVAIFCLVAVFLPGIGLELNGAHRWLHLGAFVLQPAEVTKFALIVFFASWFTKHQRLGAFLLFLSVPLGLILLQPDLGSLLVVLGIILGMYVLQMAI
jgi:cell division protein FtsW (lipid II flippase)